MTLKIEEDHLVDPAKLSTEVISQLLLLMLVPIHLNRWDEGELRPGEINSIKFDERHFQGEGE